MMVYAFLLGAISVPALDADAVKEAQKLNGEWRLVRTVFLGLQSEEMECAGVRFIFRGGRLTIGPPEANTQFAYRLDVTKRPRAIDLRRVSAPNKGGLLTGIYRFDDDELSIRLDEGERPTEFVTRFSPWGGLLFVLRRVK
jgi:uncharacterized protein (TIGR03067 family)